MKKAIIVSGYFNPLHRGHIEYFQKAKSIGDKLFVIINNDIQEFMNEDERFIIISELKLVNKAFISIDKDKSVSLTLEKIYQEYSSKYKIYFANGGDQNNNLIPESSICKKYGISLIDGLGKKIQSSSWLLNKN